MSTTDKVSLELLGEQLRRVQADLAGIGRQHVQLLDGQVQLMRILQNLDKRLSNIEQRLDGRIAGVDQRLAGLDQRVTDVKEELEGTVKIEIGGALANLETRIDNRLMTFTEDMRAVVREELRPR